jgi:hypothetical protein
MSDELLLTQLASERDHVLHAVDGPTEAEMSRPLVPSGWTLMRLGVSQSLGTGDSGS